MSPPTAAGLALIAGLVRLLLGVIHPLPQFLYDDGGITLRYAERLSRGLGLSYNDGEWVNGCSDPLYTLVVGILLACGLSASAAVQWIGAMALAAAAGTLAFTLARFYSLLAAFVGLALLVSQEFLVYSMFNGLETPLTVLLGALLFWAAHLERGWVAGAVLGALVANKVSGGLIAVAYALAVVGVLRRFPLRATAAALLVFLPMAIWLLVSFGSLLPNSMMVKLDTDTASGFSRAWVLGRLRWSAFWPACLAGAALLALLRWGDARRLPTFVLLLWAALDVGAYSLIDLGDPYPWYVAPVVLPLLTLSAVGIDSLAALLTGSPGSTWERLRRAGARRLVDRSARPAWRRLADVGGILVALLLVQPVLAPGAASVLPLSRWLGGGAPHEPAAHSTHMDLLGYTRTDLARLAAGVWLQLHAADGEVLSTGYGLPAFGFGGPVFDSSGLNSLPGSPLREQVCYLVVPDAAPPSEPGWELVAVFDFSAPQDSGRESDRRQATPYEVYARGACRVLREGLGYAVAGREHSALDPRDFPVGSRAWMDFLQVALSR